MNAEYIQNHYFQLFEDGRPLEKQTFETLRHARVRLKTLFPILKSHGDLMGHTVDQRLASIPIRNTLGVRYTYANGDEIKVTYSIRRVSLKAQY